MASSLRTKGYTSIVSYQILSHCVVHRPRCIMVKPEGNEKQKSMQKHVHFRKSGKKFVNVGGNNKGRQKFWRMKSRNFFGKGKIGKFFQGVRKHFRKYGEI